MDLKLLESNGREEYLKLGKVAERADNMGILLFDRLSLAMDLQCVINTVGLDIDGLLEADEFDFIHDITGIQNNMNRETGELGNCFLPRYSRG